MNGHVVQSQKGPRRSADRPPNWSRSLSACIWRTCDSVCIALWKHAHLWVCIECFMYRLWRNHTGRVVLSRILIARIRFMRYGLPCDPCVPNVYRIPYTIRRVPSPLQTNRPERPAPPHSKKSGLRGLIYSTLYTLLYPLYTLHYRLYMICPDIYSTLHTRKSGLAPCWNRRQPPPWGQGREILSLQRDDGRGAAVNAVPSLPSATARDAAPIFGPRARQGCRPQ